MANERTLTLERSEDLLYPQGLATIADGFAHRVRAEHVAP
jgi:hypothetical protein